MLAWTRSIGTEVAREAGLFFVTLIALGSLLANGARIGEQADAVARRMFGDFGGDFVERMAGAVRATRLAGHFVAGSREAGAKTDAYFDNAARDLLAGLLLEDLLGLPVVGGVLADRCRTKDPTMC